MNLTLFQPKMSLGFLGGSISVILGTGYTIDAYAFALYSEINSYETTIFNSGDLADIYFPTSIEDSNLGSLPITLFLQGSYVDKSNYSKFSRIVASYGFAVVVPNNINDVFVPFGLPEGFFSQQEQIVQTLEFIKSENVNPNSPLFNLVDTNNMALLGHSYGGIVGLNAIEET